MSSTEKAAWVILRPSWSAPETSEDSKVPTRRELWRGIAGRFGIARAAWIIRATDPAALLDGELVEQAVRVPAAWTLPEQLVFRFYGPGDELLGGEILGRLIPDGLEMSVDPTRPGLGFTRDGGELDYPPELLWQVDFQAAIEVGMGVSVPLDRIGNTLRIERLIVLGVRLATDEKQSVALLERLIEGHRYTNGFAIVPQGTPTNVTQDSDAPAPPDADAMLDWLRGPGAFRDDGRDVLYEDEPDGLRLAHALGIDPEAMRHIVNADRSDAREAIAVKRALWAGTLGYYAQHMLAPLLEDDFQPGVAAHSPERLILSARFFFTHFVFGRGPLPAFRVGSQPYGILPVCSDLLERSNDNLSIWNDRFFDAFLVLLHDKMLALAPAWENLSRLVPRPVRPATRV